MSKWLIPSFVSGYSATVSEHGYFWIVRGDKAAAYGAEMYEHGVYDREGNRLPVPVELYEGPVGELGLRYTGEHDRLDLPDESTQRLYELIRSVLITWWNGEGHWKC